MSTPAPAATRAGRWWELGATLAVGALVATACLLIAALNPAFFWHDDCQIGGVPMMVEAFRALAACEWPLVHASNWSTAGIAGEYQPGVFSILTLPAFAGAGAIGALGASMPAMAAAFATYMLAITAMGAFRIARDEGLAPAYATLVALVAALNGWSMTWGASNWIPAMVGFAALTLTWWALAAAIRPGASPWRLLAAGLAVYVLMSAGWPHTIFMMAIVTAWLVVRETWAKRSVRPLGTVAAAWLLGIGLAAPAWLLFVDYIGATTRVDVGGTLQWRWLVPFDALPGLVVPVWVSHWDGYGHAAMELANGLVPTAMLLTVLLAFHRRAVAPGGWALLLAGLGLALACLPSIGMFRWSFRWLPLFHIALALAAAHWLAARHAGTEPAAPGWARWPFLARWAGNPGAWAAIAVVLVGASQLWFPVFSPVVPIAYVGLMVAWTLIEDRLPRTHPGRRWAPAGITLAVLIVTYTMVPNGLSVPFWTIDEAIRKVAPLRSGVRYLVVASNGDYFTDGVKLPGWGAMIRPGNTAMLAGVELVNGYSALQLRGLSRTFAIETHGYVNGNHLGRLALAGTAPGGVLARTGVDGLVLGDSSRRLAPQVAKAGWEVSLADAEGVLMHRRGPASPAVRAVPAVRMADLAVPEAWAAAIDRTDGLSVVQATPARPVGVELRFAARAVRRLWAGRNGEAFEVAGGNGTAMVALRRAWLPGYEAIAPDGRSLPIVALDGAIIGVEVPPEVAGEVVVRYRPRALVLGAWISAATALLMLVLALRLRVRPR